MFFHIKLSMYKLKLFIIFLDEAWVFLHFPSINLE